MSIVVAPVSKFSSTNNLVLRALGSIKPADHAPHPYVCGLWSELDGPSIFTNENMCLPCYFNTVPVLPALKCLCWATGSDLYYGSLHCSVPIS